MSKKSKTFMTKKVVCKTMFTSPSLSVPHKIFPNKTRKTKQSS